VAREFNFKAFSRLILIRISIELELIDLVEGLFSMFENVFFGNFIEKLYEKQSPPNKWCRYNIGHIM